MVKKVLGGRFECELSCCNSISDLSQWNYVGKRPGLGSGLQNSENTSHLNAILQCLTHTRILIEFLGLHDLCYCGNKKFCVLTALRKHIVAAFSSPKDSIYPEAFARNLNYLSSAFLPYQLEDAHEVFLALLEKLEKCFTDQRRISSQDGNIVDLVFGGFLKSSVRCCNCSSVSETYERFLGLSLAIEKVDSLSNALESFTGVETLEEQLNQKQLLLYKLPVVAIFHLKRFRQNRDVTEKICKAIEIPLELDMSPYMINDHNEFSTKFYLYAFVDHVGTSIDFGHYIASVRSAPKTWHRFDDAKVTRIDDESVQAGNSFILFYAREDTPWLPGEVSPAQDAINNALWKRNFEASLLHSLSKFGLEPKDWESVSEISDENELCDSAGVTNPLVKTEHCVPLINETNKGSTPELRWKTFWISILMWLDLSFLVFRFVIFKN